MSDKTVLDERIALLPVDRLTDERGSLLPLDWESLPFEPRRIFTVSCVPAGTVRGGHGHRTCAQLLVAIAGEIEVL
ncbi:MAG: WxcM-like domain-containing protein, partial [Haliea sp.]